MLNYREFQSDVLAHPIKGPRHANVLVDVCKNITEIPRMKKLTGGDPDGLDAMIDAQIDRLIVASKGSNRLALFAVIAALGESMRQLHGE